MSSRKLHEDTYNALLQVPFIRKIMDTNKRLKKENKILKTLIYSMPEFRCKCNTTDDIPIHIKTEEDTEGTIPIQCEPLAENDEVVYVADPEVKKINIVYEIEEQAGEEESEAGETGETGETGEEESEASEEAQAGEEESEAGEDEAEEGEAEEESEAGEEESEAGEEEESQASEAGEEEEDEVFEITISNKSYYTNDKNNGIIYAKDDNEDVGDEVGVFVNGKAKFHKK